MFKNNLRLLRGAISGSFWGHSTPHPDTLELLNDAEWLQSSSVYNPHSPSSALRTATSRADKKPGLPGTSVRRSRIGFFAGEIIPLWCEQSQRHPGERKPIIPQQRLTLDNRMQLPRFSADSAGIGTNVSKADAEGGENVSKGRHKGASWELEGKFQYQVFQREDLEGLEPHGNTLEQEFVRKLRVGADPEQIKNNF